MALKIIRSNAANSYKGFRPCWYAVYREGGRVTTFNLGVHLRGEPPASGYIGEKGDAAFEASRNRAEEKFKAIREKGKDKGEAVREVTQIVRMKTGRKLKDPSLVDLADIYLKRIGDRSPCYLAMIRAAFAAFAAFASKPDDPKVKRAKTLFEVSPELATAFFRHIAEIYAFSTVKKWSVLLTGAFDKLIPVGMANPLKGARLAAVGRAHTKRDEATGEKVRVETVIHHRPIDRDQLRKLYATAKDDPFLYPLAVTAASTGLRISDVCTLLWSSIHLTPKKGERPYIMVEATAKTGAKIAVPIFDYNPASPDYEPDLGEFRRVLETALAEAREGERYVFPRAAKIYLQRRIDEKTGRIISYPGRDVIYSAGKRLFARALFADEPEDAEIVTDDAKPAPTTEDILAAIDAAAGWTAERKRRVADIYTRHANGESYLTIKKATGCAKSTISNDLRAAEDLVGMKTRPSSRPSVAELLKKTRQTRIAGRHGASLYSWHSLRAAFVVLMKDNGVPLDTIRLLVGHTTCDMTLEYYNPTQRQAAESARQIVLCRNRLQALADVPQTRPALTAATLPAPTADAPQPDLDALREALARLTPEARAQLLKQ